MFLNFIKKNFKDLLFITIVIIIIITLAYAIFFYFTQSRTIGELTNYTTVTELIQTNEHKIVNAHFKEESTKNEEFNQAGEHKKTEKPSKEGEFRETEEQDYSTLHNAIFIINALVVVSLCVGFSVYQGYYVDDDYMKLIRLQEMNDDYMKLIKLQNEFLAYVKTIRNQY